MQYRLLEGMKLSLEIFLDMKNIIRNNDFRLLTQGIASITSFAVLVKYEVLLGDCGDTVFCDVMPFIMIEKYQRSSETVTFATVKSKRGTGLA
jgi:hypothetical protein